MEAYAGWLRRNQDHLQSLESLVNGITWIAPDGFVSSEIGLEAATSLIGLVSVINQYIIDTVPTKCFALSRRHSSLPHCLCISAMKELEVLAEVIAEHYCGEDKKWNIIAITEGIKVLLRLALFRKSGYKMLLHGGGEPNAESEGDASDSEDRIGASSCPSAPGRSSNHVRKPVGSKERALSALTQFGEDAKMMYESNTANQIHHQAHTVEKPATERQTVATLLSEKGVYGGLFLIGETLFILRPLIYVLFVKKYGIRSWNPWAASLVVDLVGMCTSLQAARSKRKIPKQIILSIVERDELKRRKMLLVLYIMRDPFFCKYIGERLESTQKMLQPVPVVGMLTEKLNRDSFWIPVAVWLHFRIIKMKSRSAQYFHCSGSLLDTGNQFLQIGPLNQNYYLCYFFF